MWDRGVENKKENQESLQCKKKNLLSEKGSTHKGERGYFEPPQKTGITSQTWHKEHIQNPWLHLNKQSNQMLLNRWQRLKYPVDEDALQLWPSPVTKVDQPSPLAK